MQPLQICIGPTIRIGRESWCLPYAGFFFYFVEYFLNLLIAKCKGMAMICSSLVAEFVCLIAGMEAPAERDGGFAAGRCSCGSWSPITITPLTRPPPCQQSITP